MTDGLEVTLRQRLPIPLDVEFRCGAGELLALVGPSGSGKTTVLRCIAGLDRPAEGRVTCDGNHWLDTGARRQATPQERRVGMVFQHYALFPHLSAAENVAVAARGRPESERADRARELLALVNMEGLEARRPDELSGGQRQRVALARALARDPAVLLLDEPFSAVDQLTRRRLRRELAQLRRDIQIPTVLVTHDLEEAQLLADGLCVLHRGRTLQSGPVDSVMRAPANAEVARLLDHRNVYRGRVLEHEAEATWIEWASRRLECAPRPDLEPGSEVEWLVPPADVVLHRRDRPSRGEHENPLRGTVSELVELGGDASVSVAIEGADDPISFSVSLHVARRNRVEPGEPIGLSLIASGIHLMPVKPR